MLHCSWYLQQEAWKVGFNSIPFDDFSVFSFREVSFCSTVLALSLSLEEECSNSCPVCSRTKERDFTLHQFLMPWIQILYPIFFCWQICGIIEWFGIQLLSSLCRVHDDPKEKMRADNTKCCLPLLDCCVWHRWFYCAVLHKSLIILVN